jgi:hypothetical protein
MSRVSRSSDHFGSGGLQGPSSSLASPSHFSLRRTQQPSFCANFTVVQPVTATAISSGSAQRPMAPPSGRFWSDRR